MSAALDTTQDTPVQIQQGGNVLAVGTGCTVGFYGGTLDASDVVIANLPATDPHVAGQLYSVNATVGNTTAVCIAVSQG